MALHWRPVGPEPASTYWLRRAVVAAAVLLPVALVLWLTGDEPETDTLTGLPATPTAAPDPSGAASSPQQSPVPSPTAAAVAACPADVLRIEATVGEDSYRVGADPRLTLSVTNTGTTPCAADVGQGNVELLVHSGRDRIWSSDDCAPGGPAAVTTLQPGKAHVQRVTWDGRRSRPGCAGQKEQAQPGTYRVTGRVGEQSEPGDVFVFTD